MNEYKKAKGMRKKEAVMQIRVKYEIKEKKEKRINNM
jgi:hypothetical protein